MLRFDALQRIRIPIAVVLILVAAQTAAFIAFIFVRPVIVHLLLAVFLASVDHLKGLGRCGSVAQAIAAVLQPRRRRWSFGGRRPWQNVVERGQSVRWPFVWEQSTLQKVLQNLGGDSVLSFDLAQVFGRRSRRLLQASAACVCVECAEE